MSLVDKRVLVSGSTGFLGRRLANRLEKQNFKVVTLNLDTTRIDIRDWHRIREIDNLNLVYHLAAITYVPFSFENPRETYEVNVLGTLNMLELCRLRDIDKMVFTSSYVYGSPEYLPIDEEHPLNPHSPYNKSKVLAEGLCRAYNEDYGVKCVILRPFNIYGEGQREHFLIPTIIKQLIKGRIELNDPLPKRDFLYIDDMVDAYVKAGGYNGNFEIFNIGYGKSYSAREIVEKIIKLYGKKVEVTYLNKRRKNEIMDIVADINKANKKLNWNPNTGIDAGLKKVLKSTI